MFVHSYSGKKWLISEKRNLEEKKSCDIYNIPLFQSYERGGKCRVGEQPGVIVPADTHTPARVHRHTNTHAHACMQLVLLM